jgi:hypothetical protein
MFDFESGDLVWVNIPVNGETIAIPGICSGNEFTAPRQTRSGATLDAQWVNVITYHAVPADRAKSTNGEAFSYFKEQRQAAFFMRHRDEPVKELDNFDSWDDLRAEVQKSADALQARAPMLAYQQRDGQQAPAQMAPRAKAKFAQPAIAN